MVALSSTTSGHQRASTARQSCSAPRGEGDKYHAGAVKARVSQVPLVVTSALFDLDRRCGWAWAWMWTFGPFYRRWTRKGFRGLVPQFNHQTRFSPTAPSVVPPGPSAPWNTSHKQRNISPSSTSISQTRHAFAPRRTPSFGNRHSFVHTRRIPFQASR
jgi:hypothetical protein